MQNNKQLYLHFNSLNSHTPWVCGLIQVGLDSMADSLSFWEDLAQASSSKDITKSSLCQQPRWVACIFHISDGHCGIVDLVVDHCINCNCHTVFGQNLHKWRRLNYFHFSAL